jgi:hypothetical protein
MEAGEVLGQPPLILVSRSFAREEPGPLETGFGLDPNASLRLAMAPLQPRTQMLDLRALDFHVLDLISRHVALGIPLAPGNWGDDLVRAVGPRPFGTLLCGRGDAEPDWSCVNAVWR